MLTQAKERMLRVDLRGRDIRDPEVLRVMGEVRREAFVPLEHQCQAYADKPLPIGSGQTISQPYIVALMTQVLRIDRDCDVLEIGTGSGYQTAVLAKLARTVCTIEAIGAFSERARKVLAELGVENVAYRVGDGSCGWPEARTFERIMITAAAPDLPEPVREQVAEGGAIVAPVGYGSTQSLIVAEKVQGKLVERHVCGCRFVKLIGAHGFQEG
jgi:protein-L-isoaspartate(D-aspartate) O-methyltransferase